MATVIVSECTALWKEMKSRWKRKLHRRLNRKNSPSPQRAAQLTLPYPHVIQFYKTQREKQLPPDRLQATSYHNWEREVVVTPWSVIQQHYAPSGHFLTPDYENLRAFIFCVPVLATCEGGRRFIFLTRNVSFKGNKPISLFHVCLALYTESRNFFVGTAIHLVQKQTQIGWNSVISKFYADRGLWLGVRVFG
jgi:hypothetical protein